MKKVVFLITILVAAVLILIYKNGILYVYNNPNINISGLRYITPTVKKLNKVFQYTKKDVNIKYLYQNAYGSGFLNNNPIPNDLDYAVGIYLGRYNYDGKNSNEIAESIIKKIYNFQYFFNYNIMSEYFGEIYTVTPPIEILNTQRFFKKANISDVANYIDYAISDKKQYIRFVRKTQDGITADFPYVMKSGEILLPDTPPIELYSYNVSYNKNMKNYLREISVVPEYNFTLVKDSKEYNIEIVPESFPGTRLQLSRRFFAPAVFVNNYSAKFLKNIPYIKDDNKYLEIRLLSYERHLMELNNIKSAKRRPIKLLKRLMQCADIMKPALSEDIYSEISNYVLENLSKKEVFYLNDYTNICANIITITENESLYRTLIRNGEMEKLYNELTKNLKEMEDLNIIKDEKLMADMKKFTDKMKLVLSGSNDDALSELYDKDYTAIIEEINEYLYNKISSKDEIEKYTAIFENIYKDMGYHMVTIYWLDNKTIGIMKDNLITSKSDVDAVVKEKNLPPINYKLINTSEIPYLPIRHSLWVRYKSTPEQNQKYLDFKNLMLKDRDNFKLKKKFILF